MILLAKHVLVKAREKAPEEGWPRTGVVLFHEILKAFMAELIVARICSSISFDVLEGAAHTDATRRDSVELENVWSFSSSKFLAFAIGTLARACAGMQKRCELMRNEGNASWLSELTLSSLVR